MKAFVSGATGFIAGALAAALVESGWQVSVLIRPGSRNKLENPERYHILEGDLANSISGLHRHIEGCDVVFHAAAIRDRYGTSQEDYLQVNVEGTRRLIDTSVGRAKRFVYLSSVGVFGAPGVLDIDETFPVASQNSNYHLSKAAAENIVLDRARDIEVVVARPTITYGPGDYDGMLTRLISLIAFGKFVMIGRGKNYFHLTYISDLLEGLRLAGIHPAAPGNDFVFAGPSPIQSGQLIKLIDRCLGKKPNSLYIPEKAARPAARLFEAIYRTGSKLDLPYFQKDPLITGSKIDTLCLNRSFSSLKSRRILGYQPQIDYEEGLILTIKWMVSSGRLTLPGGSEQSLTARSKTVL